MENPISSISELVEVLERIQDEKGWLSTYEIVPRVSQTSDGRTVRDIEIRAIILMPGDWRLEEVMTFYVTFGQKYRREEHPLWPLAHPDGWLEVEAPSEKDARLLLHKALGKYWGFIYTNLESLTPSYYPRHCIGTLSKHGGLESCQT